METPVDWTLPAGKGHLGRSAVTGPNESRDCTPRHTRWLTEKAILFNRLQSFCSPENPSKCERAWNHLREPYVD